MYRFAAVALAAATLIAAPAFAAEAYNEAESFTVKVKTSDIDLSSEKGAKTALQRINKAALQACSGQEVGTRIARPDQSCIDNVSVKLVQQINAPMVQAAYEAQKASRSQG
jgi:UrcA family protein